jgi:hypothetical protein
VRPQFVIKRNFARQNSVSFSVNFCRLTLVAKTGAVALAGLAEMAKFETYTSSTAITAGTCMQLS